MSGKKPLPCKQQDSTQDVPITVSEKLQKLSHFLKSKMTSQENISSSSSSTSTSASDSTPISSSSISTSISTSTQNISCTSHADLDRSDADLTTSPADLELSYQEQINTNSQLLSFYRKHRIQEIKQNFHDPLTQDVSISSSSHSIHPTSNFNLTCNSTSTSTSTSLIQEETCLQKHNQLCDSFSSSSSSSLSILPRELPNSAEIPPHTNSLASPTLQHIIHTLQDKILLLNHNVALLPQDSPLSSIRQCVTDRRIIQESLQDIQAIDPLAETLLRQSLLDTDTILELEWKPKLIQFIQHAHQHFQQDLSTLSQAASSIQSTLHHTSTIPPQSSSWLPTTLQLLTGIGFGLLAAFGISKVISTTSSQSSSNSFNLSTSNSSSTSTPDQRFIPFSLLRDQFDLFIQNSSLSHSTYSFSSLPTLIQLPSDQALEYLIDFELLLQFL